MMNKLKIAILHYTSPPIMGGVEAVIDAHSRLFASNGHEVTIIAGRVDSPQDSKGLLKGVSLRIIPEMDSLDPSILAITHELDQGNVPKRLAFLTDQLEQKLTPILSRYDHVFIHNLWTKHFNFPLTIALYRLMDAGLIKNLINWCHDFTWGSPNSGHKMHPGFPWNLLRTYRADVKYVVGSYQRKQMLVHLFDRYEYNEASEETLNKNIQVIPNGVSAPILIGLSGQGEMLVNKLNLLSSDLILLMPMRISQAKNIEFALMVLSELKNLVDYPRLIITGPPDPHNLADKERYQDLKKQTANLGLETNVHFVYDSGEDSSIPNLIDHETVGQLMRVADVVFMPSHREGFGIPIFEAGLLRVPVWCSSNVPSARELEGKFVNVFDLSQGPAKIAQKIHQSLQIDSQHNMRNEIRQNFTWSAVYRNHIQRLF